MKERIRHGIAAAGIALLLGLFGYHAAVLWTDEGKTEAPTVIPEREPEEEGQGAEGTAGGPAIENVVKPTYVGYTDITFKLLNGQEERSVKLYLNGTDAYVFLPSYADLSKLQVDYDEASYQLVVDGRHILSGTSPAVTRLDKAYDMEIVVKAAETEETVASTDIAAEERDKAAAEGQDEAASEAEKEWPFGESCDLYTITFMKSENLPTLYIDTFNGTMAYLDQAKTNEEPGSLLCLTEEGRVDTTGKIRQMHGRGATSWNGVQKGYTIHLSEAADILRMEQAENWRLVANVYDATRLRNALAYSFAQDLELPYAIDHRYVDVYFNGEYNGNYLLCEAVEVAENRMEPADVEILMEVNDVSRLDADAVFFTLSQGRLLDVRYPKDAEKELLLRVRHDMDDAFKKIEKCGTEKDSRELAQIIDIDSFAKMYLINGMTNEPDSNGLSTFYYYKHGDPKLYSGPAWDFDRGFGDEPNTRGRYPGYNAYGDGPSEKLMSDPAFSRSVQALLVEKQEAVANIQTNITVFAERIRASVLMTRKRFGNTLSEFMDMGDPDADLAYLQQYTEERIALMEETIRHPEAYHKISISNRTYWLEDGETFPEEFETYLCKLNGWDHLAYVNGASFRRDLPIRTDLTLNGVPAAVSPAADAPAPAQGADAAGAARTSAPADPSPAEEKGDLMMTFLAAILLITPGLLALLASGDYQVSSRRELPMLLLRYIVFEFLSIMIAYGAITLVKGAVTISFSGISRGERYTIFQSNTVSRLSVLFLAVSIALGVGEKRFGGRIQKWLAELREGKKEQ